MTACADLAHTHVATHTAHRNTLSASDTLMETHGCSECAPQTHPSTHADMRTQGLQAGLPPSPCSPAVQPGLGCSVPDVTGWPAAVARLGCSAESQVAFVCPHALLWGPLWGPELDWPLPPPLPGHAAHSHSCRNGTASWPLPRPAGPPHWSSPAPLWVEQAPAGLQAMCAPQASALGTPPPYEMQVGFCEVEVRGA